MSIIRVSKQGVQSLAGVRGMDYLIDVRSTALEESPRFYYMEQDAYEALRLRWPAPADVPTPAATAPLFDRVLVINRACRTDRWSRISQWWDDAGMASTTPMERFTAVEGKILPMPPWWYAGGPAWGCAQSHIRAIEACLVRGDNTALLLEDDVCFVPDFKARTAELMAALPPDWDQVYLGGQYLQFRSAPPWRMSPLVREVFNVNRTHAYALSRPGMHKLYSYLTDYPRWQRFRGNAHIDHYLGQAHNQALWSVYAPNMWVCGQGGGISDLTGGYAAPVYWDLPDSETSEHTPVVVMGAMRSGTSVTAGVLERLGVYMGENLLAPSAAENPDGFFEDQRIWSAYRTGFDIYTGKQLCGDPVLIDALSCVRRAAFSQRKRVFGLKHVNLANRPELLRRVLGGGIKVVHVTRDRHTAAASLRNTKWYPQHECLAITNRTADAIAESVKGFQDVLTVRYEDLLSNAEEQTGRLAKFIGIGTPHVKGAAALVKPDRPWSTNVQTAAVGPATTGDAQ